MRNPSLLAFKSAARDMLNINAAALNLGSSGGIMSWGIGSAL